MTLAAQILLAAQWLLIVDVIVFSIDMDEKKHKMRQQDNKYHVSEEAESCGQEAHHCYLNQCEDGFIEQ